METYWELGANINRAVGEARAAYGAATVMRLSRDIGVSKTDLYNAMALAFRFGKSELSPSLTWSHFRTVLPLGKDESKTLAARAARSGMSVRRLRREVLLRRNGRNRQMQAVYGG
ncbi:MAG: DUF1016 N-terminal domain-containing protein, partial [Planctomycetes bacterium]|nr:DUF1016 N-terminal domain-containing protein [Planctomycetota bacterium]